MDDIFVTHILKSSNEILQKHQSFTLTQFLLFLKIAPEVSLSTELGDDVHIIVSLIHIKQPNDVLVLHLLHYFDLGVDVF